MDWQKYRLGRMHRRPQFTASHLHNLPFKLAKASWEGDKAQCFYYEQPLFSISETGQ